MSRRTTGERTATYKGRTYRLLWLGNTKFGSRARLQFMDGSKDFWVAGTEVSGIAAYSAPAGNRSARPRNCCGYPCPVSGRKCTPTDPCHDCR